MSKRNYNVFFDLHSVTGIIISVGLFVIFFCGGYALVKTEVELWEKGEQVNHQALADFDFDYALSKIKERGYNLQDADIMFHYSEASNDIYCLVDPYGTATPNRYEDAGLLGYFKMNAETYEIYRYYHFYSYGEFIYRLHFFHQLPTIGIYLAGFISLFFFLAIISGIVIHWEKMWSNFFLFRSNKKLKTLFTDLHTSLGFIGLPFQLMYAVTGMFLAMSAFALLPAKEIYNGDTVKVLTEFRPTFQYHDLSGEKMRVPKINPFFQKAINEYPAMHPHLVWVRNYGDKSMLVQIDGDHDNKQFVSESRLIYSVKTGEVISRKSPDKFHYADGGMEGIVYKSHFGSFGGKTLKIVYFLLTMLSCLVIVSGVIMWVKARDKRNKTEKERQKNFTVEKFILSVSYALILLTAIGFTFTLLLPDSMQENRQSILYSFFFWSWLALCLILYFTYDRLRTAKRVFVLSAVFFLLAIIIHGFTTSHWPWKTFQFPDQHIFIVDAFLLISALICFGVFAILKTKKPQQN